jgi:hypothetical protein
MLTLSGPRGTEPGILGDAHPVWKQLAPKSLHLGLRVATAGDGAECTRAIGTSPGSGRRWPA